MVDFTDFEWEIELSVCRTRNQAEIELLKNYEKD
jgi:hypothetical protein